MELTTRTPPIHPHELEVLKLQVQIENLKYLLRLAITQQPVGERLTREELRHRAQKYID